jgi:hypothetical protein
MAFGHSGLPRLLSRPGTDQGKGPFRPVAATPRANTRQDAPKANTCSHSAARTAAYNRRSQAYRERGNVMITGPGNEPDNGEEHHRDLPADIPYHPVYAYNLDDTKTPGGIKVRWKIRVSQITQIDTLSTDPADTAAAAMRARCSERFAELHHERQAIQAQLDSLDATAPEPPADLALLDDLPLLGDTLDLHPERLRAALYEAFDIQALYKPDMHQVTLFATITSNTPRAVAAILTQAGDEPAQAHPETSADDAQALPPGPENAAMYPLPQRPMMSPRVHPCDPGWRRTCLADPWVYRWACASEPSCTSTAEATR